MSLEYPKDPNLLPNGHKTGKRTLIGTNLRLQTDFVVLRQCLSKDIKILDLNVFISLCIDIAVVGCRWSIIYFLDKTFNF